jgi:hypothetical protein
VREVIKLRSRRAAAVACALSALVHGAAGAVLATAARPPRIAAPLEEFATVVVTLEVEVEVASEGPAPLVMAGPAPLPVSHVRGRRPAPLRPPPVLPTPDLPEEVAEAEPEPVPVPPEPAPPPARVARDPAAPPLVEPEVARALRIQDTFPSLIERSPMRRPDLDIEVCVSAEGAVSDAVIRGAPDRSTETLRAAILKWQYRALTVNGAPTPFCHLMRISYRVY